MSAAHWRKAMNSGAGRAGDERARSAARAASSPLPPRERDVDADAPRVAALPVAAPVGATRVRAGAASSSTRSSPRRSSRSRSPRSRLRSGMIALSLAFLGGYGGMISLAQMTVAGIAGYLLAIFGSSGTAEISLNWPWWVVVPTGRGGRDLVRHAHRLALGAHRGHLHDHDHARHRRRVSLPRAAELQRVRRLPGPAARLPADRPRHRLAIAAAVLLPEPRARARRRTCSSST